jgi:hypothetical protein
MRTLKVFGLALVAVFAMSAVAAATASATQNQFHSTKENTTLTVSSNATQEFTYEAGGIVVSCTTVGGSGQVSGKQTTTEVTFSPTYSGCSVPIPFTSVQIDMNGCDYLFTIDPESKEVNNGPVHVKCPTEGGTQKQITITVKLFGSKLCDFHIAEQTPDGVADYSNKGTEQIDVTPTQTGIDATKQGSNECGGASSANGTYTGRVQVTGEITTQQTMTNVQVG